jgi:hypothetical protein
MRGVLRGLCRGNHRSSHMGSMRAFYLLYWMWTKVFSRYDRTTIDRSARNIAMGISCCPIAFMPLIRSFSMGALLWLREPDLN